MTSVLEAAELDAELSRARAAGMDTDAVLADANGRPGPIAHEVRLIVNRYVVGD